MKPEEVNEKLRQLYAGDWAPGRDAAGVIRWLQDKLILMANRLDVQDTTGVDRRLIRDVRQAVEVQR